MWTAADLERALEEDEGQYIEFKQENEIPRDIAECVAALANSSGGTIIFGIAEDPIAVVGVRKFKQVRGNIIRATQKIVTPPISVDISKLEYQGHTLILVTVAPGTDVYQASGKFVARYHDQNLMIPPDRLRALMIARGLLVYETVPIAEATIGDLDLDRVAAHIQHLSEPTVRQLGLPTAPTQDTLDFLRTRHAVADQDGTLVPTVLGLLMFGKHPQKFLLQAGIAITVFIGQDTSLGYRDNVEVVGSLPIQIETALDYLWTQIRHGGRFTGAAIREEVPEYPRAVLRELLVNALAHRDYSIAGSKIRISLFTDRLELASPGGLAGHITLENILREQYSRNPKLVRLLLEAGYIEERGMGLDNVYHWLRSEGRPEPELEDTGGSLIVTLHSPLAPAANTDPAEPARTVLPAHPLNASQRAILGHLGQHGEGTIVTLQATIPTRSRRMLQYDLNQLTEWGLIERVGGGPTTLYHLPPGPAPT